LEAAKALGGSFKFVTLARKTAREMTSAQGNKRMGTYKQIKKAQMSTLVFLN